MQQYYFLSSLLPELQMGVPPDINSEKLKDLIEINLTEADKNKVKQFRTYYDLLNLRSLWKKEKLSSLGNYTQSEMEHLLLHQEALPPFVFAFLEKYDKIEERLKNFTFLIASYFQEFTIEGFLKKYLQFERDLRIILTGLRAKKLKRNLLEELQYEDPHELIVSQLIAQKDATEYEPPAEYEEIREIFEEHWKDPSTLYHELNRYRLKKIEEISTTDLFSVDKILAYLAKLTIIEQDLELDQDEGRNKLDKILKEAR